MYSNGADKQATDVKDRTYNSPAIQRQTPTRCALRKQAACDASPRKNSILCNCPAASHSPAWVLQH